MNKRSNKTQQSSNIYVSQLQKNNKIIVNEFNFAFHLTDDIISDFHVKHDDFSYDCFYLSLKYHELFPDYIQRRLEEAVKIKMDTTFSFILFLLVDIKFDEENKIKKVSKRIQSILSKYSEEYIYEDLDDDYDLSNPKERFIYEALFKINLVCFENKVFLILCFEPYDIGQYIYSLSLVKNNVHTGNLQVMKLSEDENLVDSLCSIDKINKNDATNLLKYFRDLRSISFANKNLLQLVPKMNTNKLSSLEGFLNFSFNNFKNI